MIDDLDDFELDCPECQDHAISASSVSTGQAHAHCEHHRRHAPRYAASTCIV